MATDSSSETLEAAWGRRPWPMPRDMLDLSGLDIRLPALEAMFRRMPPDKLFVRVPGAGPASGPPQRIRMSDVPDLDERLQDGRRLRLMHKMNRQLRRIGLRPAPVGSHPLADRLKLAAAQGLRGVRRLRG